MTDMARHFEQRGATFLDEVERHLETTPQVETDAEYVHFMREAWRMAHFAPERSGNGSDAMAWAVLLRCMEYEDERAQASPHEVPVGDRYFRQIFGENMQ